MRGGKSKGVEETGRKKRDSSEIAWEGEGGEGERKGRPDRKKGVHVDGGKTTVACAAIHH